MMKSNEIKVLEELEIDLLEIQAYRELQDESFCFPRKNQIKNESNFSEDAVWRMHEQYLKEKIAEKQLKLSKRKNNKLQFV